jgi:hypothetical protein
MRGGFLRWAAAKLRGSSQIMLRDNRNAIAPARDTGRLPIAAPSHHVQKMNPNIATLYARVIMEAIYGFAR